MYMYAYIMQIMQYKFIREQHKHHMKRKYAERKRYFPYFTTRFHRVYLTRTKYEKTRVDKIGSIQCRKYENI